MVGFRITDIFDNHLVTAHGSPVSRIGDSPTCQETPNNVPTTFFQRLLIPIIHYSFELPIVRPTLH